MEKNTSPSNKTEESEIDIKRFGHTMTLLNNNQALLFGGAKSISELFNDTLIYYIKEKFWLKLEPIGDVPSARAAHAACYKEGAGVLIFGGANKNGGYASNELYLLELGAKGESRWVTIPCREPKPQRRYGHIILYSKPNLIVSGGVLKDKNRLTNDLWVCDLSKKNYGSEKMFIYEWTQVQCTQFPPPRMYHTAGIIKSGRAKGMILIFGGRGEQSQPLNDTWGLRKHRDGSWEWITAPCIGNAPKGRYQHSAIFFTNNMIILGGLGEPEKIGNESMSVEIYNCDTFDWSSHFFFNKFRHASFLIEKYAFTFGGCDFSNPLGATDKIVMFDVQELCNNVRRKSKLLSFLSNTENKSIPYPRVRKGISPENEIKPVIADKVDLCSTKKSLNRMSLEESHIPVATVKKVSFDEKLKFQTILGDDGSELYQSFIDILLKPGEKRVEEIFSKSISKFRFRREHIVALARAFQEIIADQPMVLKINAPIKIFGDIHGQYDDLMRFFEYWGEPSDNPGLGDIQSLDYLFLGDYVDRGCNSLETICLLMALKINYPDRIHLLRGNHEDILINFNFGFKEECDLRLSPQTDEELDVYKVINEVFEYLPLAAVVEDQILCIHGGIGGCLSSLNEIEEIERPLSIIHEATNKTEQIVMDILWSDPTENDDELGIQPNPLRDSKSFGNIVKYGPDVVEKFLEQNNLSMIIRAHECVPDGFERFSGGNLITIFSATDYCRRHKNAGAMLLIKNNFEIVPHLIYPTTSNNMKWFDDEETLKKRPPTPLRRKLINK